MRGRVTLEQATAVSGTVGNIERVWSGMKAGLRSCINRGLVNEPRQHGQLRVVVDIGTNGEVAAANAEGGDGLTGETIDCVLRRVKSATFLPPDPEGSRATVVLPMTFDLVVEPGPVPR